MWHSTGSICGHKLFTLGINDIYNISKILRFTLFADDTNTFYYDIDIDILCKQINGELNKLHVWFNINKLSLNISTTNYMMFSNSRSTQTFHISINGVNIRRVCAVRYIGVHRDDKLYIGKNTLHLYAINYPKVYLYYTRLVKL